MRNRSRRVVGDTVSAGRAPGARDDPAVAVSAFSSPAARAAHLLPGGARDLRDSDRKDWNLASSGAGLVTRFGVDGEYLVQFDMRHVVGRAHAEYWMPAERLDEFNDHLIAQIDVIAEFRRTGGERREAT